MDLLDRFLRRRARDPVCGARLDPATAAGSSRHGLVEYHFCSPACKVAFDADPARYAGVGPWR